MTSLKLILYLMCLFLGTMAQTTDQKISSSVRQEKDFISAKAGENVTLRCFMKVVQIDFTGSNKPWDRNRGSSHPSMYSATYYCASGGRFVMNFSEGSTISVKGSGLNIPALVHQSASEIIQPGGSVTLNCTLHTGSCDGEHSVYWFKNSEVSYLELIHTHTGSSDQCEWKPNTQTHTCDYNLPMKNLNLSHAGTYYCAVASCGHILFGNRTKLDFEPVLCLWRFLSTEEVNSLVYFLSGALTFNSILVVLLALLVYKMNKRNNCQSTESEARLSTPSTENAEGYRDADSLHYAAISFNVPNRSRRQRNITNSECVYSGVKL
ncbi:uncharacterized protein LOC134876320 [Eleginops maclovinus]|uniref:uncharacterized protein LOC134876320 n=1 Tax=Eleginops maclovinus TaxID=56733 RepID=UPI0030808DD9